MILVNGLPLNTDDIPPSEMLLPLLEHPSLVSASNLLTSTPVKSAQQVIGHQKHLYLFQREHATVDPQVVQDKRMIGGGREEWGVYCLSHSRIAIAAVGHGGCLWILIPVFIGTDESTTCVGIVIRNPESGMTSVGHLDSPRIVDSGLTQMLSSVLECETSITLNVHLIGAFKDADYEDAINSVRSEGREEIMGYSFPLCSKIIEALQNSRQKFELQTLCVLGHNTRKNHDGHHCPIISGFLVETLSGSVMPVSFDQNSRCPDELVRRLRVMASSSDPSWRGKLLDTYDTGLDRVCIAPCLWRPYLAYEAKSLLQLSDADFLLQYSTSPFAEDPDFVENQRRFLRYLIEHPDWRQTFPNRRPCIFERTTDGGWSKCHHQSP